ncbi:DUF1702 family protein [Micromonospora sp. NPDC049645]|uniref:DUF1702 family protein n=1 Tax=Micromonospora sp. NPDC049645 TaxID=3155508 RepID=UPI00341B0D99
MPTTLGSLKRLVLTPSLREVTFERRGFPGASSSAPSPLEAIPQAVICGFEWGIDAHDQWEVERRLSLVEPEHRGFAYEGATMAFTVLDAMRGGRGHRTRDLLLGPGQPHIFLAYIGIGFAMAKLPRMLWKGIVPDLSGTPYHPTMSWLAVDGYGFDLAFFKTGRWVDEQRVPAPYPFQGSPDYFTRAVDQGIGRALWFIHNGRVTDVATAVERFATQRQADLWSGVGLAATFAGGCAPSDLATLRRLAGPLWTEVAQGSVFAAKARHYSGTVPPHSETAIAALAGLTVEKAAVLADDVAVVEHDADAGPAYEQWRQRIRTAVAASSPHGAR